MAGNAALFEKLMNQGHSAAWDQEWDKAVQYYRQALEEFPDHPKAVMNLALAYYEVQNYQEALVYYQRSAELSPEDPTPMERIAELLEQTGSPDKAVDVLMKTAELHLKAKDVNKGISDWQKVVLLNPGHFMAHSRLALVYERLGRRPEAMKEYLALTSILQHAGEVQKAIQAATRALQMVPDSPEAGQALEMLQAGHLLTKPGTGRPPTGPIGSPSKPSTPLAAPTKEEEGGALDPIDETRQKALSRLAALVFEQMDIEDDEAKGRGMQALEKGTGMLRAEEVDKTQVMIHLSQAVDYQTRKQDVQAIDDLERAINYGLDHPCVYFDLAYLLNLAGRSESATRNLQKALHHPDYALGARLLMGQILFKLGRVKEAAPELLEALKQADAQAVLPEQAETLRQLYDPMIESYAQLSEGEAPVRLCENILDLLVRKDWKEHIQRARQQLPSAEGESAPVPLADILTEARSNQVVDAVTKINQLIKEGKLRTAMEEAFYALQFAPTYLPLHILMGEMLMKQEQVPDAIEKLGVVARNYNVRGEANRSIGIYKRIVTMAPMDFAARQQLIDLLNRHNQSDAAVNEYLHMVDIYYNLADLENARKTCGKAVQMIRQVSVSRETKIKLLHRLADIDLQSLDWKKALVSYEQIRSLKPEDQEIRTTIIDLNIRLGQPEQAVIEMRNYAGYLLEKRQQDAAIKFMERMGETYPQQPLVLRQLAEVYRLAGRTEEAIRKLDAAGDMFLQAGNRAASIEVVMAILAMNPPNASEYQQVLARLRG